MPTAIGNKDIHRLPIEPGHMTESPQELLDTAKNYKTDTLHVHCQATLKAEVEAKGCLAHTSDSK
ncbi:hypothetical protein BGZ81_004957 [Podila clonocystis]|nr:hypothetical protein BGZ81_004957 [Podila clonocystis]